MNGMGSLLAASSLFLGMHWIVSGSPLRDLIVARTGVIPFKILFSLIVALSITWMAMAFGSAPDLPTWGTASALKPLAMVLMALAFVMFALGLFSKNPNTQLGVSPDQVEVRGIVRITRHSAVLGLGLWGLAHFIVNGDWASHILYGSFVIQGLIAPLNMDRKFHRRYGKAWEVYTAQTSYLPFVAILSGRNRLVLGEINWIAVLGGLAAFGLVFWFHEAWFGGSPYP